METFSFTPSTPTEPYSWIRDIHVPSRFPWGEMSRWLALRDTTNRNWHSVEGLIL